MQRIYKAVDASVRPREVPEQVVEALPKTSQPGPLWRIWARTPTATFTYDSDQARTISVREAARLQSFPDGFVMRGKHESRIQTNRQRCTAACGLCDRHGDAIHDRMPVVTDIRCELLGLDKRLVTTTRREETESALPDPAHPDPQRTGDVP